MTRGSTADEVGDRAQRARRSGTQLLRRHPAQADEAAAVQLAAGEQQHREYDQRDVAQQVPPWRRML